MKNLTKILFFILFASLVCVAVIFLQKNNIDGSVTGETPKDEQVEELVLEVAQSYDVWKNEEKQMYLYVKPANAIVSFLFEDEQVASITKKESDHFLNGIEKGQTNCIITAKLSDKVVSKTISINVNEKEVKYFLNQTQFFAGEQEYNLKIETNFDIDKNQVLTCDNILINQVFQEETESQYITNISFYLKEEGCFIFTVNQISYENFAFEKPNFIPTFAEEGVFDIAQNKLTLYSNISNQTNANKDFYYSVATLLNNLTNYDLKLEDNSVVKLENNSIIAKNNGNTTLTITSKILPEYQINIDIEVKSIELISFDVFIDNQKVQNNQVIELEINQTKHLKIENLLPNYANFNQNFEIEIINGNIFFDNNSNTIIAQNIGIDILKIKLNSITKTISFNILPTIEEEEPQQEIVLVKLNIINKEQIEILNNSSNTIYVDTSNPFIMFDYAFEKDGVELIVNPNNLQFSIPEHSKSILNQRGSIIEIVLQENTTLTISCQTYTFTLNLILV